VQYTIKKTITEKNTEMGCQKSQTGQAGRQTVTTKRNSNRLARLYTVLMDWLGLGAWSWVRIGLAEKVMPVSVFIFSHGQLTNNFSLYSHLRPPWFQVSAAVSLPLAGER